MNNRNILFFADRLPPLIGGMEMHGGYFIEYFQNHKKFPIAAIITKNEFNQNCLLIKGKTVQIDISTLDAHKPAILFFNSGRWIEELMLIREKFKNSFIVYRTGGNEILKAPLSKKFSEIHSVRQSYWVDNINSSIDLLITNSKYTEDRLHNLGIKSDFKKIIGGVNAKMIASFYNSFNKSNKESLTIFCAARFVPYKNHFLLLSIIKNLILKGYNIKLKLAGDGPLYSKVKEQVEKNKLNNIVTFLGAISNNDVCREIVQADIYMQLSQDYLTEVQGGSYIHSECMGRSILEAISAGTFIIAGQSGALQEIVTPSRGTLLNLSKNVDQLAEDIEQVINQQLKKLPFTDEFCWTKIFKQYEKLFEV